MSQNPTPSPKPTPNIIIGNQLATDIITAVINGDVEQLGRLLAKADIATLELVLDIFAKLSITGELLEVIQGYLLALKAKKTIPEAGTKSGLKNG